MKTPYACPTSGGFFSAIWGVFVLCVPLSCSVPACERASS